MRDNIEFRTEDGTTLRGWWYAGRGDAGGATVVMAHGFSATKEMYLDDFADLFAESGLNVLVYDNRNTGESDGEPRREIDPLQQVRDYRDAITWVSQRDGVDPERIGIWGRTTAAVTCSWSAPSTGGLSVWSRRCRWCTAASTPRGWCAPTC